MRMHHRNGSRDFKCPTCPKSFFNKACLASHLRLHTVLKTSCYFCKRKFATADLVRHTRTHTQEKPFNCPKNNCKYSSSYSNNLQKHWRTQHPPVEGRLQLKSYFCYFCSKMFTQSSNLVTHVRSHTLEKPFTCGLCLKRCNTQGKLTCHIYSHTMEKPFKCKECQKSFRVRYRLRDHIRAVHRKEKRFYCEFCDYSSYQKANLAIHVLHHDTKMV